MCLGVPGKIVELYQAEGMKMAKVDFGGVLREACMEYLPDIQVGDYTIVHVGFGISKLNKEEADETLKLLAEIDEFVDSEGDLPREIYR